MAPSPTRRALSGVVGAVLLLGSLTALATIVQSVEPSGVISLETRRPKGPKRSAEPSFPRSLSLPPAAVPNLAYAPIIRQASELYRIPEALILAVITVESGFDPKAVSPANAQGLMQLMPATAAAMQVTDPMNPRENILGGTRLLRLLANTFNGDLVLTLAAYNAGEGAVMRHAGVPPYRETRDYVTRVIGLYRRFQAAEPA